MGLLTCPAGTQYEMIFYCPKLSPSPPPSPPSPPSPPPPPSPPSPSPPSPTPPSPSPSSVRNRYVGTYDRIDKTVAPTDTVGTNFDIAWHDLQPSANSNDFSKFDKLARSIISR